MIAKKSLKYILSFIKVEHTVFSLPLVLTGAWFGMNKSFPDITVTILIVFAVVGARIFGISFNRIFDMKIDSMNPRTLNRELPSGKMSVRNALIVALFGLCFYIGSCALLGGICLKISLIPLVPLFFYSFMKRFTFFCHFGIGFCLALAPLSAFIAASGHIKFELPVIIFSAFVFLWLSGADIIYAILDVESDRVNGIHSIPVSFGVPCAQKVAACLHISALILVGFIILLLDGGFLAWFGFLLTSFFFCMMYIPSIPLTVRFFPLSSLAAISGSIVPFLS